MKRLFASLGMAVVLMSAIPASATISYDLNLPGIGRQIPIFSYSLDVGTLTLTAAREIDGYSPALNKAVGFGTVFSNGSLDKYDPSFSATIPLASFVMNDIVATGSSFSGGDEMPIQLLTLQYEAGRLVSNSVPEPSSVLLLAVAALALVRRRAASGRVSGLHL